MTEADIIQRFKDAGHTLKLDDDGDVDMLALDCDYHNGPMCTVCYESCCVHCTPNFQPAQCPGQEGMDRRAKEARRKQWEALKQEFGEQP